MASPERPGRVEPSEPRASERLNSWKEIAAYFKRDQRTVRRWEEREGLPVHRHEHQSRAAVFAYKSELEAWWHQGRKRLETDAPATATSRARRYIWPVATAALLVLAGGTYLRNWLRSGNHQTQIDSIAILPLANLSRDPGQDYLADGLTEALTTDLGKLSALRVISRTSTARFKGTSKSVPEIARELGVDALVEGAVQRSGDRVRVTAQLIEARTDRHVWAETYDRELRDVLTLQADVARAIAVQVRGKLTPVSATRGAMLSNPEVYELYLKGRYARDEGREEGLKLAFEYFQQALEKDPQFAPAYAGLADCYARLPFYSEMRPGEAFPKAKAAALKALALDQELAEAHASMAYVKTYYDWDWAGAEDEFRKALALNPNYAEAHHSYSRFLASLGRVDEARAELRRAQELDPLSLLVQANKGVISYFGRQYEQAIQELQTVMGLDPKFFVPYWGVGLCYEQLGRYEDAVAQLQTAIDLSGRGANGIASLGHAYGLAGRRNDAQKILAELAERSRKRYVSSYQLALVNLGLQQTDEAMTQLENAYQERSTLLTYLKMDPRFDPLRSEPRFKDLLRRIGLPP
jgi:TolB-like protein/Flp pilus assembly protein TadD